MLLRIFSYFIIPVYTIFLALQDSLFESNLSVISSNPQHKNDFMLWCIMVVLFLSVVLTKVIKNNQLRHSKLDYFFVYSSCLLLLLAAITPYVPSNDPVKAKWHIIFAFSSTVFVLFSFLTITLELYQRNAKQYKKHLICIIAISLISILLLVSIGIVSSFLEIVITISSALLAKSLLVQSQTSIPIQ